MTGELQGTTWRTYRGKAHPKTPKRAVVRAAGVLAEGIVWSSRFDKLGDLRCSRACGGGGGGGLEISGFRPRGLWVAQSHKTLTLNPIP